ncbi:MAG: ribosome biogenesis GTPase Der [Pseudomonadales bacterium]|nr:ribosome biogenesis GTPase Der [Pseudomonadales bacterium]
MRPVIALIGRPNVGKSTLFNQLTRTRDALVADFPGLTRDRKYGDARVEGRSFIVIDTGGLGEGEAGIEVGMAEQSRAAMTEADILFFMVDARSGMTSADQALAKEVRSLEKRVILVVNKVDGMDEDTGMADFFGLGFREMYAIAASHGRGVLHLISQVLADVPETEPSSEQDHGIRIAVVGRPNVGKSTLVNRMLGEDRVVVFDMPGTTRDSIYIPYERHGKPYTLIDTAGVRRRGKVDEVVEKFSVIKTLQAIKDAHVVVAVLDAREGIVDQDLHLLGYALEAGRALVLAINKWDGMSDYDKQIVRQELDRRLGFVDYVRVHFISARHGTGVGELYPSVHRAYDAASRRVTAAEVTRLVEDAMEAHQPPLVHGRRIKLRYGHMGGNFPPTFIFHGNQTQHIPAPYRRYLENVFRRELRLEGTPIRMEFRSGENPFKDKPQVLTQRQVTKRRRLLRFVKGR